MVTSINSITPINSLIILLNPTHPETDGLVWQIK